MGKRKGKHEVSMEIAKDMLDEGIGMGKIKEKTGLDEENIKKAKFNLKNK